MVGNIGKVLPALVDVGGKHLNADFPAFLHCFGDGVEIIALRRHDRRHELRRKMGFEIRSLVGNDRVGGCVRLVEPICGKRFNEAPKLFRRGGIEPVAAAAA